jgi:hypothetical protein
MQKNNEALSKERDSVRLIDIVSFLLLFDGFAD